ncbi:MAG: heme lyase CcmF/NrfE family subunit, partial [Proteobacteria bacterium]|nr:heme lyase CcmF/NrfE family subunit [Pseudomonadota bacterium]
WVAMARPLARGQFAFIAIAFMCLVYAFITYDFSVAYVAQNSNSALPLRYRISAVWGGHEGSLLLWALILSIWTLAVSIFSRSLPEAFVARVLGVMGLVSIGFLLFMLLTSNPFTRLWPEPLDGADLNPLLQDFGLIIHPPVLYMGYVGFSVAFGFAIAALLDGRLDATWARWSRPWTIAAWIFLTIGIALGSWWAYYELGWGGWWFWDPVENASFMPWLVGTALIHSLAATEKRGVFKRWTILLAICAFSLSLLGTFLVRSGVLTSVHAFATDPARGVFILIYLGVVIGGSLTLYAWRAPGNLGGGTFKLVSRETLLLINNILLIVAMVTILLGTLYPLILDALGLGKLSVGPPYFNTVFIPLMALVALFQVFGALSHWKQDKIKRLLQQLRHAAIGSILIGVLFVIMLADVTALMAAIGIILAAWIIFGSVQIIVNQGLKNQKNWSSLRKLPRSFYGMSLAHIGLGVTIIGITISSLYSTEKHVKLVPGESFTLSGYTYRLADVSVFEGPNYRANIGKIEVFKDGKQITVLLPEKRVYHVRNMPMTEAGIDAGFTRDLYVSLGEPIGADAWSLRLYYKPFIRWIWLGAILMGLGGLLAITDKRYRLSRNFRQHSSLEPSTSGNSGPQQAA